MISKKSIFISISVGLLILKSYASGMTWTETGIVLALSDALGFVIWRFRKKIVRGVNEMCEAIFDGPSLLPLAVTAMMLFYNVLLQGCAVMNTVLVVGVLIVHLLNIHLQTSFCRGAVATLFINLLFQVVAIGFYASISAITAVTIASYTAFFLLAKRFSHEKNVLINRTYAMVTFFALSTLILLYPFSLAHLLFEIVMAYEWDTIGWAALSSAACPVLATIFAGILVVLFFICCAKLVKSRPSAVFASVGLWYILFTRWERSAAAALCFTMLVCYLLFDRRYYSLEDLIGMDTISDSLEREVINEFITKVSNVQDLAPLEEYLYHHPNSIFAWSVYLHLARSLMDHETYARVVRIAERILGKSEDEILLPEPTWIHQE